MQSSTTILVDFCGRHLATDKADKSVPSRFQIFVAQRNLAKLEVALRTATRIVKFLMFCLLTAVIVVAWRDGLTRRDTYQSQKETCTSEIEMSEIDSHLFRTDVNGLCKMHCYLTLSKHNLLIDTAGLTLEEICSLLPLSVTLCLNESINQNVNSSNKEEKERKV